MTEFIKRFLVLGATCMLLISTVSEVKAQVAGRIFRDFNVNGVRDSTTASALTFVEPGVPNLLIKATGTNGVIKTSRTNAFGRFVFSESDFPVGTKVRVEVTGLWRDDYFTIQKLGSNANGTGVQFVTAGPSAFVTAGVNYPADYCVASNKDPLLITPCYIAGNPLIPKPASPKDIVYSEDGDVLVGVPYSLTGMPQMSQVAHLGIGKDFGSLYGVAYERQSRRIYTSAFLKRHVGLGPGGLGAIYQITLDADNKPVNKSLFLDLVQLGFNVGTINRTTSSGSPLFYLYNEARAPSYDRDAHAKVGRVGLGGLDMSDDGKELYTVNLFTRELYRIKIKENGETPVRQDVSTFAIPNPGCPGQTFRPFAVKYWRKRVYVGGVCSNENQKLSGNRPDTTGMRATVYEFDGTAFKTVLSFPLTYKKGASCSDKFPATNPARTEYWMPWTNDTIRFVRWDEGRVQVNGTWQPDGKIILTYPQPMLGDIEFDADGSMILGIRDRAGDQMGDWNFGLVTSDTKNYMIIAPGDILRAGKCDDESQWTLERGASVCTTPPVPLTLSVRGNIRTNVQQPLNGQGPGGGEFYFGDVVMAGENHDESCMGSLALWPGRGEVAMTCIDPIDILAAGGLRRLSNTTGYGNRTRGLQLYDSEMSSFGKANGLGDLELTCEAISPPIEIGNRIWFDRNGNGVQDADELGLDGIRIELYKDNQKIADTVTANGGQYYFRNAMLTFNTVYQLRIALNQPVLADKVPSTPGLGGNVELDSDGKVEGTSNTAGGRIGARLAATGYVARTFTTGTGGQVSHAFDFGFNCIGVDAGPDQVSCAASIKLPTAPSGQQWDVGTGNPSAATINPQTGEVTGMTLTGTYRFVLKSGTDCSDEVIITRQINTNATLSAELATCRGPVSLNNGVLRLQSTNATDRYQYSPGLVFNAASAQPASPTQVPATGILTQSIPNVSTSKAYTVRVTTENGCVKDLSVAMPDVVCECPPTVCVPVQIKKRRSTL